MENGKINVFFCVWVPNDVRLFYCIGICLMSRSSKQWQRHDVTSKIYVREKAYPITKNCHILCITKKQAICCECWLELKIWFWFNAKSRMSFHFKNFCLNLKFTKVVKRNKPVKANFSYNSTRGECNPFYFVAETQLFYVKLVREALAYFTSIITFKHCALELDIEHFSCLFQFIENVNIMRLVATRVIITFT